MQGHVLDNILWSRYQVSAHVYMVKFHFIQSARHNIPELHNLRYFESEVECLEFIECLLAKNYSQFLVAECVEHSVQSLNQMLR